MSLNRIIGLFLVVVGIVFLVIGISATQAVTDTVVEEFTGRYTDKTMIYLIVGSLMVLSGGILGFRRVK